MQKFNEIKALINGLEADAAKAFVNKNKAAGVRLRKGMLDLKKLAQEVRVEVSEVKNS